MHDLRTDLVEFKLGVYGIDPWMKANVVIKAISNWSTAGIHLDERVPTIIGKLIHVGTYVTMPNAEGEICIYRHRNYGAVPNVLLQIKDAIAEYNDKHNFEKLIKDAHALYSAVSVNPFPKEKIFPKLSDFRLLKQWMNEGKGHPLDPFTSIRMSMLLDELEALTVHVHNEYNMDTWRLEDWRIPVIYKEQKRKAGAIFKEIRELEQTCSK